MDRALQMIQLQQQLNDATNGENWEEGVTQNGKVINWKRCIYMECAEMIDSFSWKHWKSIHDEPDWENLQIEVVDVWHFVMSLALQEYAREFKGSAEELALYISELDAYDTLKQETVFAAPEQIMTQVERIMYNVLAPDHFDVSELIEYFLQLCYMSNLDLASLYRLYIGKNVLNQFRQDHGYKMGTYTKVWHDKEDNLVMKLIWEEQGELTPKELYRQLEQQYNAL